MAQRTVNITEFNPAVSGIQADLLAKSADIRNNLTAIEAPLDQIAPIIKRHEEEFASIERKTHIRNFNDESVTLGSNSITIAAGATKLIEVDSTTGNLTERTGWGFQVIDVTGIATGTVWAIYPGLTYTANDGLTRPVNGYRVLTFTNAAGTVTHNKKTFENVIESDSHIFEGTNKFRGTTSFETPPTGLGVGIPLNYHDVKIEYIDNTNIKILSDSLCRDQANIDDIKFTSDIIININN